MPNKKWRTTSSWVHKIRLHGRRGKGTAESFSREKLRQAPQKEGGEFLCATFLLSDPGWYVHKPVLDSDGMSSWAERALGWKAAAPAPSAGGEKRKAAQPSGAAKVKAQKIKNTSGVGFPPSWACRAAWYGDTCRRNGRRSE